MPSRSLRVSKSHSVLVKSTWEKSSSDLYRQDHPSPSIDNQSLCLANQHLPDLRPKAKPFAACQKLFLATGKQAHGATGRLMGGIDKDRVVLIKLKEKLRDRAEELAEQELKLQSSTTISLESEHPNGDCEPSPRDFSSWQTIPSPAVVLATSPHSTEYGKQCICDRQKRQRKTSKLSSDGNDRGNFLIATSATYTTECFPNPIAPGKG